VTRVAEKIKVTPPAKHQYQQTAAASNKKAVGDELQADSPDAPGEPRIPPTPTSDKEPPQGHTVVAAAPSLSPNEESTAISSKSDNMRPESAITPSMVTSGMRFTRSGDSYTFQCSTIDEAERLRDLLSSFADWLKKSSWVSHPKQAGDQYLVKFHAKSLIDFLRQQGF
jgi:hypothetical protein